MADIANKSTTELRKDLREKREQVRSFEFAITGSGEQNSSEYKKAKKDIARILTELRKREKDSE